MSYVILVFGALMFFAGIVIAIRPEPVYRFFGGYSSSLLAYVMAIVVRLILGIALLLSSAQSKFPIAIQVIGWLSLVAAIVLVLIGRQRFRALIAWAVNIAPFYHHLGGLVAMLFGGFLVYAVV